MLNIQPEMPFVSCEPYDILPDQPLFFITLKNEGITVYLTNLGCCIMAVYTPDRNGVIKNIAAGFEQPAHYLNNPWYFGCVVGRYANRIAAGKFLLDGQVVQLSVNNQENHLHGGFEGLHKKIWNVSSVIRGETECGVEFEYRSEDGEEGYPGNLQVKVKYLLNQHRQLEINYTATTDKKTPVNLTNHSYFNLTGFELPVITTHLLYVNAGTYTPKNEQNIPDGRILPLAGTPLDFSAAAPVGQCLNQLPPDEGLDHNFVLTRKVTGDITLAVILEDKNSGRTLYVYTDQPGIQVYTANYWDGTITGQQGFPYVKHGAIALETQAFPDSPNHPDFPGTILAPGDTYHTTTIYGFGIR